MHVCMYVCVCMHACVYVCMLFYGFQNKEVTDDNEDMITIEELKYLNMQKNRKSCGLDNLPMELWKFGGNELKNV